MKTKEKEHCDHYWTPNSVPDDVEIPLKLLCKRCDGMKYREIVKPASERGKREYTEWTYIDDRRMYGVEKYIVVWNEGIQKECKIFSSLEDAKKYMMMYGRTNAKVYTIEQLKLEWKLEVKK